MKRFFLSAALLLAAAPALAAAPGDVVRSDFSDPYYVDGGSTRMVFPDAVTVQTWGNPVARSVDVPTLSQWLLAGAMPIRQGSRLVKFGTDPQVYAVGPNGVLHWITSERIASALYGAEWDARVVTLFPSFFPLYQVGTPVDEARHPDGTLLKYASSPTVYYVVNGVERPFASEAAFRANNFDFGSVVTVSDAFSYVPGNPVYGWERDLGSISAS